MQYYKNYKTISIFSIIIDRVGSKTFLKIKGKILKIYIFSYLKKYTFLYNPRYRTKVGSSFSLEK